MYVWILFKGAQIMGVYKNESDAEDAAWRYWQRGIGGGKRLNLTVIPHPVK